MSHSVTQCNTKHKHISLRLDIETYIKLEQIAKEYSAPISSIIRRAIKYFLREVENAEVKK